MIKRDPSTSGSCLDRLPNFRVHWADVGSWRRSMPARLRAYEAKEFSEALRDEQGRTLLCTYNKQPVQRRTVPSAAGSRSYSIIFPLSPLVVIAWGERRKRHSWTAQ